MRHSGMRTTTTASLLFSMLLASPATVVCQLRPRRVATNAMGEQDTPAPVGGGADDGMEGLQDGMAALSQMMGGGAGGMDLEKMMANMDLENNPLLKGLADANPEVAQMLKDPEAMKAQMAQMAQLFSSEEGQGMASKMMEEMQQVLTDPEKLKSGLEQLSTNPALKGIADAVPGLKEMLDDPDKLNEQAEKAAELFQSLQDPEKAKELLGGDLNVEKMQEMMAKLGGGLGADGTNGDAAARLAQVLKSSGLGEGFGDNYAEMLSSLGGGGDEDGDSEVLKARVKDQLAAMMGERGGGDGESGGAVVDDDEAF